MQFRIRGILPLCILFGCCFFSQKSYAFDYNRYNKEHRQLRSLTAATPADAITKPSKESKSKAFENFANRLLEAMQSDAVPARIFDTGTDISFYFKPAKVTKLGIKYKF